MGDSWTHFHFFKKIIMQRNEIVSMLETAGFAELPENKKQGHWDDFFERLKSA